VPKTTFSTQGIKARLTLAAASTAVGAACANLSTAQAVTTALNGPDATVAKTGCTHASAACSLVATSQSNANTSDWSYGWSIVGNNSIGGSSSATYTPTITVAGTYTARLVITNAIGSQTIDTTFTLAAPVCQSTPTANNIAISFSSPTSTCGNFSGNLCKAGETITFQASGFGYTADTCDTYLWTFGDGTTSNLKKPSKSYSSNGSYSVSLKLVGGLSTADLSSTVNVGTATPPPPPPPPPCGTMVPDSTVFIDWSNSNHSCGLSGGCTTGMNINFSLGTFGGYQASCANHSYSWSVNGQTGFNSTISKSFSTPGTYPVTLTVSNGSQTVNLSANITITGGSTGGGSCPTIDPNRNVFINFSNPSQSCSVSGGTCSVNESLAFSVAGFGYSFACGTHTYAWRFGDGSTGTGQSTPHTYTTGGTYNVECDVNNGNGVVTLRQTVQVGSPIPATPDPVVNFSYETFGSSLVYKFTPTVDSVGGVTKWNWNFGDGSTSTVTGTTPAAQYHSFAAAGTYTVTLTPASATKSFAPVTKTVVVSTASRGRAVRRW
jgi:large repetitive protein